MASGSATRIYDSSITTGGTAETVTLAAIYPTVVVENYDATAALYVTTGVDTDPPKTPTVGGEDEAVVAPNTSAVIPVHYQRKGRVWVNGTLQWVDGSDTSTVYQNTVVKLISSNTSHYTVSGNI